MNKKKKKELFLVRYYRRGKYDLTKPKNDVYPNFQSIGGCFDTEEKARDEILKQKRGDKIQGTTFYYRIYKIVEV